MDFLMLAWRVIAIILVVALILSGIVVSCVAREMDARSRLEVIHEDGLFVIRRFIFEDETCFVLTSKKYSSVSISCK